jgi:hypothetical protein
MFIPADSMDEILNSEMSEEAKVTTDTRIKYIRVVFLTDYIGEEMLDQRREAYKHYCYCKASDVEDVKQDDMMEIKGVKYNIEAKRLRSDSWAVIDLSLI